MSNRDGEFEWVDLPPDPIDRYCDILAALQAGDWNDKEVMINFVYVRTRDQETVPVPSMPKMYTTFGQVRTVQTLLNEVRAKVDAAPYHDLYSLRVPQDVHRVVRTMRDKKGNKHQFPVTEDLLRQDGDLWYPCVKLACRPENHTYVGEVGYPAVDIFFDPLQIEVTGL